MGLLSVLVLAAFSATMGAFSSPLSQVWSPILTAFCWRSWQPFIIGCAWLELSKWAGPYGRAWKPAKKWRAWAEKLQPESFQGFLARPNKARNPVGLARPGCGQPESPQKNWSVWFFIYTGLDSWMLWTLMKIKWLCWEWLFGSLKLLCYSG